MSNNIEKHVNENNLLKDEMHNKIDCLNNDIINKDNEIQKLNNENDKLHSCLDKMNDELDKYKNNFIESTLHEEINILNYNLIGKENEILKTLGDNSKLHIKLNKITGDITSLSNENDFLKNDLDNKINT